MLIANIYTQCFMSCFIKRSKKPLKFTFKVATTHLDTKDVDAIVPRQNVVEQPFYFILEVRLLFC